MKLLTRTTTASAVPRTARWLAAGLLTVLVLSVFLFVMPVYWLVMPALSTGTELLFLIFTYSFVFGYLGGRSPALKSGPIEHLFGFHLGVRQYGGLVHCLRDPVFHDDSSVYDHRIHIVARSLVYDPERLLPERV